MFAAILLQEAGPNTELSWLLYLFLAFFFLMVIVGWLTSRRSRNPTDVQHNEQVAADEHAKHEADEHSG